VAKRAEIVAKAVGKRIRELRKRKGWSQERLADESEMHRSYMWGIEQGRRNPSLRHLSRIADALEVGMGTLFDGI
jgi:transcriptional regulator with XRE-family HTH domain